MTRRSTDVLNKTWTLIDEADVIDEESSEQGGEGGGLDDINNNTRCIVNNETYLSTSIDKRKSTYLNNFNLSAIDSFKKHDLSDNRQECDLKSQFVKAFNIDHSSEANFLKDIDTFLNRASLEYDPLLNELFPDYLW